MIFQHNVFFQRDRAARARAAPLPRHVVKSSLLERALPRSRGPLRAAHRAHRSGPAAGRRTSCATRSATTRSPTDGSRATASARAGRTSARPRRSCPTPRWAAPSSTTSSAASTRSVPTPVAGDLVECGTGRGGGAIFMRAYLDAPRDRRSRRVFVADRFRASRRAGRRLRRMPGRGRRRLPGRPQPRARRLRALRPPRRPGALPRRVRWRATLRRRGRGYRGAAAHRARGRVGEVRAGARRALRPARGRRLRDRRRPARVARLAGRSRRSGASAGITTPLERVDASAIAWRQDDDARRARRRTARRRLAPRAAHPPLAPPAPADAIDLTVVVVFYNMRREAARTLHSLSRAYQEGIDDLDYEVIVVENGSDADQRLGEEFVRSFGPEFRYLDIGRRRRRRRRSRRSTAASAPGAAARSR